MEQKFQSNKEVRDLSKGIQSEKFSSSEEKMLFKGMQRQIAEENDDWKQMQSESESSEMSGLSKRILSITIKEGNLLQSEMLYAKSSEREKSELEWWNQSLLWKNFKTNTILRDMRFKDKITCTPQGLQSKKQCNQQYSNSMCQMPYWLSQQTKIGGVF